MAHNVLHVTFQGCAVELHTEDIRLLRRVEEAFPYNTRRGAAKKPRYAFRVERSRNGYSVSLGQRETWLALGETWPTIDHLVELAMVKAHEDDRLFVHAASVRNADAATLLVGSSTSGKSTLAWALAQHGFSFLADDVTPIDIETCRVHPFKTRIQVRPDTAVLASKERWRPPYTDNQQEDTRPCRMESIIFLAVPSPADGEACDMSSPLREWERMAALLGMKFSQPGGKGNIFWRSRADRFQCAPSLQAITASEAMKRLGSFLYPSGRTASTLLPFLCKIIGSCRRYYELRPGPIGSTTALLLDALDMRPAHPVSRPFDEGTFHEPAASAES